MNNMSMANCLCVCVSVCVFWRRFLMMALHWSLQQCVSYNHSHLHLVYRAHVMQVQGKAVSITRQFSVIAAKMIPLPGKAGTCMSMQQSMCMSMVHILTVCVCMCHLFMHVGQQCFNSCSRAWAFFLPYWLFIIHENIFFSYRKK